MDSGENNSSAHLEWNQESKIRIWCTQEEDGINYKKLYFQSDGRIAANYAKRKYFPMELSTKRKRKYFPIELSTKRKRKYYSKPNFEENVIQKDINSTLK
jgi:hypothetical protein